MKYCPQCKRQFTEPWLGFCSDDGTPLIEELSPPADPNWNPKIRQTEVKTPSEQETQWLPPRQTPASGAWIAPDERPPMSPGPWQPPPPPYVPPKQPTQGLALASMIISIIGLVIGCFGPIPGIIAIVLGVMALSQIKKSPQEFTGKSFATAGIIIGAISLVFYLIIIIWFLFAGAFG